MQNKSIEDFFEKPEKKIQQSTDKIDDKIQRWVAYSREYRAKKIIQPSGLSNAYLLSATYNGEKRVAVLKFYHPQTQTMESWYDNSGHKPYCFSSLPIELLKSIPAVASDPGIERFETAEKYEPFLGRLINVNKIVANDPLTIGGKPTGSIRDLIPAAYPNDPSVKVWEADIKYYENYIYDKNLDVGIPYNIKNGKLIPVRFPEAQLEEMEKKFSGEPTVFRSYVKSWATLLESPLPDLKYAALDIEVESPALDRIPDPGEAAYPVICASVVASDGVRNVFLLKRENFEERSQILPKNAKVEYCENEVELMIRLFEVMLAYPVLITFNGDSFDLRYIWHRSQKLGFLRNDIPIDIGREYILLTYGVHIDLYKFFFNRAIQIYAFDQKYKDVTLQDVAVSLIGKGKIILEKNVSELTYAELAEYCLRDSELTYNLATFDNRLVLNLIIALARIAKMPVEDVTRQGVSNWIRSMMYNEHRRKNILIPKSEEILALKGVTTTTAVIKGKKYRGAVVIEPKPGINFNVVVLDFASLYPSIIKKWNLSYETVRCPHEECKNNVVPETSHWVCTKKVGLTSLLIGSLRDLRVKWYKVKAKDLTVQPDRRVWYSIVQRTLKVVLNASYGVFGAEHFALYCPPVAEATASVGRYAIKSTVDKAQELGIDVIYGDTDSMFLKNPAEDQIKKLIAWSDEKLGMELDVDKKYRYSVFSSLKKNYIGVYLDGNVEIKGLTGKKRNTPEFLKSAFKDMVEILGEVKSENEFYEAKEKIKKIVKECHLKLKRKQYLREDLAFTVVLGKNIEEYEKTTPQHVKALKRLSDLEKEKIGAGSIIHYVKVRKEPGVKLVTQASIDEIDTDKYVEHIQTTFEPVLDALGISFNEIIGISRLEQWV